MKSILIDGIKLNFIDINQSQPNALLFLHGNSHSLKSFYNQVSSPLFKDYRQVFVDLPGHGDSSKDGNYSLKNFAQILKKLISTLELQNVLVVGHSMGGHVAINMLKNTELYGLFLFGTPPLKNPFDPNAFLPNPNGVALAQTQSTPAEIELLMKEMNYKNESMTLGVEDYLKTDPTFRQEIVADIINGTHENEIVLIKSFQGDVLILVATNDGLINNNYIRNEFLTKNMNCQLLEIESGHSPQIEVCSEFNQILADFSKKVFEKSLTNQILNMNTQHENIHEQRN